VSEGTSLMKYIGRCTLIVFLGSSHLTTSVALTTRVVAAMYMSIDSSGVSAVSTSGLLSRFLNESSASYALGVHRKWSDFFIKW
jgi:hypothetical protein